MIGSVRVLLSALVDPHRMKPELPVLDTQSLCATLPRRLALNLIVKYLLEVSQVIAKIEVCSLANRNLAVEDFYHLTQEQKSVNSSGEVLRFTIRCVGRVVCTSCNCSLRIRCYLAFVHLCIFHTTVRRVIARAQANCDVVRLNLVPVVDISLISQMGWKRQIG